MSNSKDQSSEKQSKEKSAQYQLTQEEAKFISTRLLPKGYSLQLSQRETRGRVYKKTNYFFLDPLLMPPKRIPRIDISKSSMMDILAHNQAKVQSNYAKVQETKPLVGLTKKQKVNEVVFKGEQLAPEMATCWKALNKLKKCESAWPFLQPVDPDKLNVPEYFNLIKEPMDLQTVQRKLKQLKYANVAEFHADIMKIIQNSYSFNPKKSIYYEATAEVDHFYKNLSKELFSGEQLYSTKMHIPLLPIKPSTERIISLKNNVKHLSSSDSLLHILEMVYYNSNLDDKQQYQIELSQLPLSVFQKVESYVNQLMGNKTVKKGNRITNKNTKKKQLQVADGSYYI